MRSMSTRTQMKILMMMVHKRYLVCRGDCCMNGGYGWWVQMVDVIGEGVGCGWLFNVLQMFNIVDVLNI